jgi:hypothetical protein
VGRRRYLRAFERRLRSRSIAFKLAWANTNRGAREEAFRPLEPMKTLAPACNENLELEFLMLSIGGQREAAAAVGERLAGILHKKTPNLDPYLDLSGEASQRERAPEELPSRPRDSRRTPTVSRSSTLTTCST